MNTCNPEHRRSNRRQRAACDKITSRLAKGRATKAELNQVTGLVDCTLHVNRLRGDGVVRRDGTFYVLAAVPTIDENRALEDRLVAILSDLRPHRLARLVEESGGAHGSVVNALERCISAGTVERLSRGVYAKAGTYPRGLPVSTRDPSLLTKGEAHALRYLCERLVVSQGLGVEDLEHLTETVAADSGGTAREAAAGVHSWLEGLVAKGRVEVRGQRLAILRDVANARVQLAIVPIGGTITDSDEDQEDDDAPGEGLEGGAHGGREQGDSGGLPGRRSRTAPDPHGGGAAMSLDVRRCPNCGEEWDKCDGRLLALGGAVIRGGAAGDSPEHPSGDGQATESPTPGREVLALRTLLFEALKRNGLYPRGDEDVDELRDLVSYVREPGEPVGGAW